MKKTYLLFIVLLIFKGSFAQISLASLNDFEDGTTMGWQVGGAGVQPINVNTGGPNGAGDNYLACVSDGSGANGRLVIFNTGSTWTGNWTTAGVNNITFKAKNPGTANLTLRISLDGGGGRISVTNGVFLPAGSGWTTISIPVGVADFTLAGGSDIASTLSAVSIMRIIHSTTPSWQGTSIVATLDLDVIAATSNSPANDDAPGSAAPGYLITVGAGCTGSPYSNASATQSASEPFAACKGTAGYKTVWFSFIAPGSGNVKVSTDYIGGTMGSDSRIALFSASDVNNYATFSNIACDDDNGVSIVDRSILYATGLLSGNTYYIQVDGNDGTTAEGTFCLTVDEMTASMISTSTACAAGQPLTSVNDNYTGVMSATDASGNLVALIRNPSGGATTSTYTNALNINTGPVRQDANGAYYLDRNYRISNAAVTNVNVQFFFLNSELTSLQTTDPDVMLANLQVTRQTGDICDNDFIAANGTNSSIAQTINGSGSGFNWIQVQTQGFSKFFIGRPRFFVPLKTFLQGAFTTGPIHKPVTTTWANVLNANALSQPYNVVPFSYAGTESVGPGFFTSTAATTDIVDWVLVEIRMAIAPAIVVARRVGFIREDGRIVDLYNSKPLSFGFPMPPGFAFYHVVIRHRNHLPIRTSVVMGLDDALGFMPPLQDFTTAQATAFQNPIIISNAAQRDLTGGVFGMWGGNVNSDGAIRATGLASQNDYLGLITALGNNPAAIIPNVYNRADLNMDGTMRATGLASVNDYLFLIGALDNNPAKIVSQHQ